VTLAISRSQQNYLSYTYLSWCGFANNTLIIFVSNGMPLNVQLKLSFELEGN